MVEAVGARSGERVLDVATGTGLVAEALVRRYGCSVVGLDQSDAMLAAARARLRARRGARASGCRSSRARRSACRSPTASSTTSRSPTCCATWTIRRRRCASSRASCGPAGGSPRWSSRCRPRRCGAALWRLYTRIGLPALGRLVSREWRETGRFLARSIPDFYARHPLEQVVRLWSEAGIGAVQVRRMSLGGGVVMWGTRAGGSRRPARAPRVLRAAPRRMARSRHAAAPAVHGVASELRRPRRGGGAEAARRPAGGGAGRVLPRGRRLRARARRAQRPAARDAAVRPRAVGAGDRRARRRGGDRRRRRRDGLGSGWCRSSPRARSSSSPTTSSSSDGRFHSDVLVRGGMGRVPGADRLLDQRARDPRRRACSWRRPASCSASPSAG